MCILTKAFFSTGNVFFHLLTVLVVAPLFGVPSGMYPLHHRIMHHVVRRLSSCTIYAWMAILNLLRLRSADGILPSVCAMRNSVDGPAVQESNGQGRDLSSTEQYQRDNILHFLWYIYALDKITIFPPWTHKMYCKINFCGHHPSSICSILQ